MASFFSLLNKELKEHLRTYKLLIVVAVFLTFGLATPLLLKYMSLLLPAEGAVIPLPEFTAGDVAKEYIDTLGQVGLIAAILVAMGAVARERELGTVSMILSKPVGCGSFITAKWAALALAFATGIAVGAVGCYVYTTILFGSLDALNFLVANLLVSLYLLLCLSVTLMYSSLFKSQLAAGGLALISLVTLAATSGLPVLKSYSPGVLLGLSQRIASGNSLSTWGSVLVSIGLVILTTLTSWQVFKRKEL